MEHKLHTPHAGRPSSPQGLTQFILLKYQLLFHLLYLSMKTTPGSAEAQAASPIKSQSFLALTVLYTLTFLPALIQSSRYPSHLVSYSGSEVSGNTSGQSASFFTASINLSET